MKPDAQIKSHPAAEVIQLLGQARGYSFVMPPSMMQSPEASEAIKSRAEQKRARKAAKRKS